MNIKGTYIISLMLLFIGITASAQMVEAPSHFSNTDTTGLLKKIDLIEETGKQYPDSALKLYREVILICNAISYKNGTILAYVRAGNMLSEQGKYHQALQYFKKGQIYCKGEQDFINAMMYNNIGSIYTYLTQYESAVQAFLQGAVYARKYERNGAYPLRYIYRNLAIPLMNSRHYDRAHYYLDLAYEMSVQKKDYHNQAHCLFNKGIIHNVQGNIRKSEILYDSGLALAQKHNLADDLFFGLCNSANLHLKTGKIEKAISQLHNAHTLIAKDSIDIYKKVSIYLLLGKAYTRAKQYDSAQHWLDKAQQIVSPLPHNRAELLNFYAQLYEAQGKHKLANQKLHAFMALKDSLDDNERSHRIAQLETQYRTAEKDKKLMQNRLELNTKDNKLKITRILLASGIAVVLLLLLSLVLYRRSTKTKQKQMRQEAAIQQLETAMESEQKERSRIAMELHDGIISSLTAIKLNLEIAKPQEQYRNLYLENLESLGLAILDIRNTAHNLMPEILIQYHPEKAIELLCSMVEKTGKLQIAFLAYGDFSELDPETGLTIYRIAQELLQNIIKHASAEKALVQLSCYGRLLSLTVEDNGKGMKSYNMKSKGLGLNNIEKRVAALKGTLTFGASGFGSGISVHMELEIKEKQESLS